MNEWSLSKFFINKLLYNSHSKFIDWETKFKYNTFKIL